MGVAITILGIVFLQGVAITIPGVSLFNSYPGFLEAGKGWIFFRGMMVMEYCISPWDTPLGAWALLTLLSPLEARSILG